MSNTFLENTSHTGLSDRATITSASEAPESGSTEVTQGLPGCEAQESLVRELHAEWLSIRRRSLQVAMQLGRNLAALKAELKKASPKRKWESYTRDHLGIEPRTASNYLRIHREASTTDGILGLLESETISEMGVRDALDFIADLKKASKTSKQSMGKDSAAKNTSKSQKAAGQPPLRLLDGSQINLEKLKWADGLVTRGAIESWMSAAADTADPLKVKNEARRQRFVIQIAAEINRACGKGDTATAKELVESSLDAFRMILSNSLID